MATIGIIVYLKKFSEKSLLYKIIQPVH